MFQLVWLSESRLVMCCLKFYQSVQAGPRLAFQFLAFSGIQSLGIEAMAVMPAQQLLQRRAQVGQRRFRQRAFKPAGKRLTGLARHAADGQFCPSSFGKIPNRARAS